MVNSLINGDSVVYEFYHCDVLARLNVCCFALIYFQSSVVVSQLVTLFVLKHKLKKYLCFLSYSNMDNVLQLIRLRKMLCILIVRLSCLRETTLKLNAELRTGKLVKVDLNAATASLKVLFKASVFSL